MDSGQDIPFGRSGGGDEWNPARYYDAIETAQSQWGWSETEAAEKGLELDLMIGAYERRIAHEAKIMAAQMALMFVPPSEAEQVQPTQRQGRRKRVKKSYGDPLIGAGDAEYLRRRHKKRSEQ